MGFCLSSGRVDGWLMHPAWWVLRRLCRITGRPGSFFALRTWWLGVIIFEAYHSVRFVIGDDFGERALFGFLALFWTLIYRMEHRQLQTLISLSNRLSEGGDLSVSLQEAQTFRSITRERVIRLLFGGIFFIIGLLPISGHGFDLSAVRFDWFGFSWALTGVGLYFATCFHGGGKSVWARAKDKVTAWVSAIDLGGLVPAPVPVGARSAGVG